ncbi:hypothetical protein BX600DRAFT_387490 [Xylariales sp. PMI_506]|nr:hypothetical protein BX600DRAFT_387490 [Xylariales sp. PMI_506]
MGHDVAESPAGVGNRGDFAFDDTLNLEHLELLIHLIHDHDIAALADQTGPWFSRISIALQTSLKWPFLLYELLAFSARHLAFLRPERSAAFLHQAITLQTRAVSLFNSTASWATTGVIDQSNCVAVLLFSSILGHHLLADTLARRDPGGLDAFMDHYVQCVKAHRGVLAVASGAWPLLMESQLEPALSLSSGFTSRPPRGSHCQPIFELVEGAHGLADADKEACRLAVQYMQVGFDAVLADEGQEKGTRYQMIMLWTVMAPPEFTSLLAAKRPEVLIILSYYAALLHYGKHLWQVGDAGAYILGIIVDYLGQEWDHWLEFPRSIINIDLE